MGPNVDPGHGFHCLTYSKVGLPQDKRSFTILDPGAVETWVLGLFAGKQRLLADSLKSSHPLLIPWLAKRPRGHSKSRRTETNHGLPIFEQDHSCIPCYFQCKQVFEALRLRLSGQLKGLRCRMACEFWIHLGSANPLPIDALFHLDG